ncbi:MAG: hypothetical protein GC150_07525 [Rhizobiales bacterium]|nr:hypothetical protein [Hyphomicrobiales bacterium]
MTFELNLEPGQFLAFRTIEIGENNQPLWRGRARLMSGTSVHFALWSRTAAETGQRYLGGTVVPETAGDDVYSPLKTSSFGRIALFDNDKDGNEGRPDLRGRLEVDGERHYVSVWKKPGKGGVFLAGQVQDQATIDALKTEPAEDQPEA